MYVCAAFHVIVPFQYCWQHCLTKWHRIALLYVRLSLVANASNSSSSSIFGHCSFVVLAAVESALLSTNNFLLLNALLRYPFQFAFNGHLNSFICLWNLDLACWQVFVGVRFDSIVAAIVIVAAAVTFIGRNIKLSNESTSVCCSQVHNNFAIIFMNTE